MQRNSLEYLLAKLQKACGKLYYAERNFKFVWSINSDYEFTCRVTDCRSWLSNSVAREIAKKLKLDPNFDIGITEQSGYMADIFLFPLTVEQSPVIQELIKKDIAWSNFKKNCFSFFTCGTTCESKPEQKPSYQKMTMD